MYMSQLSFTTCASVANAISMDIGIWKVYFAHYLLNLTLQLKVLDFAVFLLLLFYLCMISGFCCEVDENCTLLGNYTASSGNFLLTFYDNLVVES